MSVLSVVTGSTSLITFPVVIALGIEAHVAIAANIVAFTFMSVGALCRSWERSPQPLAALDLSHDRWFWLGYIAVAYRAAQSFATHHRRIDDCRGHTAARKRPHIQLIVPGNVLYLAKTRW